MITISDLYHVLTAVIPLYVAMILAYGSVKCWKIFSPDQCSGINRFVALFAVPLLSFHFIASNNPYAMNYRFIAADTLQKLILLVFLSIWSRISSRGSLGWSITLFSLSTLRNTLVMGIPLLKCMYGDASGSLMVQIVVLQCIIWYTLMLFLFEYRGLIAEQFLILEDGKEPLETQAEVGDDGKLHVTVRKSTSSRSEIFSRMSHGHNSTGVSITPRPSNLSNAEIYSLQSSRNMTPRDSSFNHNDIYSMANGKNNGNMSPRTSNFGNLGFDEIIFGSTNGVHGQGNVGYPKGNGTEGGKDLHMFVWSSSASPVSEGGIHVFRGGDYGNELGIGPHPKDYDDFGREEFSLGNKNNSNGCHREEPLLKKLGSSSTAKLFLRTANETKATTYSDYGVRKLIRNPNTYSSLLGLTWSLISFIGYISHLHSACVNFIQLLNNFYGFRWNIEMPAIIAKSISILSYAGLGMAMFSLGLFMALQPRLISCGKTIAAFSMAVRFISGPAVMAAASIAIGLRGVLLHIAIVQAALPQGIVPFVFAKDYSLHPDILCTGVIFGMLIALPITLVYYILLGL
ncbi:unnamed protein product [Withania somnifera]